MEFKLILKKLNNSLTAKEDTLFSKWYTESNSHRDYFDSVKKNYNTDLNNIDIEKGWLAIQNDLKITKPKKNYWKYAVAASILLLISISFVFNKKEDVNKVENPIIVESNSVDIKTGTDKAILTLEDGTNVALGKGTTYQNKVVSSNGEQIVYDTAKKKTASKIEYNYLTIPRGGEYYLKLSDGTEVWLNSESQLKFPIAFIEGDTRKVELIYGEAYFDVSPSSNHKDSKFLVLNENQEIEVLGTEFNVKAYKGENHIYTTLVEGKVTVDYNGNKQNLIPNQQSKLNLINKDITINSIDVYSEISWRKGLFSFKSKPLEEIMVVLSRWYDFEFEFETSDLKKVRFNGVLSKKDDLEEILEIIKNTKFINAYEIKNKKLTIK